MDATIVPGYDVAIKRVEALRVATIHCVVPPGEQAGVGDTFDRLFGLLEEYVQRNGRATGPFMAIYIEVDANQVAGQDGVSDTGRDAAPATTPGASPPMPDMHVELAIPFEGISEGISIENEQVRVCDLPGLEHMAFVTHKGSFEEIGRTRAALFAWAQDNGYRPAGPLRDVYLSCGDGNELSYITEVQLPLER